MSRFRLRRALGCVPATIVGCQKDKNESISATVLAFDDQQLLIDLRHSVEPDIERYRMYPSQLGKHALWNLQALQDASRVSSWVFARLQSSGEDRLRVQIIQDSALRGADAQVKLADARARAGDDAIFADSVACARQTPAK